MEGKIVLIIFACRVQNATFTRALQSRRLTPSLTKQPSFTTPVDSTGLSIFKSIQTRRFRE